MVDFIEPMLCKPINLNQLRFGNWDEYLAELKIDGWRAIIVKSGSDVAVYSRTGKDRAGHVPHIVGAFQRYAPDGVYDGEVVFANVERNTVVSNVAVPEMSFNRTARIMGSSEAVSLRKQMTLAAEGRMHFVVFDVLEMQGQDLKSERMEQRAALAKRVADDVPYVLSSILWAGGSSYDIFIDVVSHRLEGLVLKNANGIYTPGKRPTNNQYKIKAEKFFDVVVCGYTMAKEGKFEGLIGALKFGVYDDKMDFVEIGQTSGMTDDERIWWTQLRYQKFEDTKQFVIEIKSNALTDKNDTGYGTPRHPQYIRLRDDKNPQYCLLSQFKI